MICKDCSRSADWDRLVTNPKNATFRPEHCNRNDCMCQHRTLPREEYLKEAK